MKSFSITFLSVVALVGVVAPTSVVAQTPRQVPTGETTYEESYVPCGTLDLKGSSKKVKAADGTETTVETGDGIIDNPCKFTDIIVLAKRLITGWIVAGVLFATMGFAYAGLLYITAMGSSEKISHAHMIFVKTFWGFFFMLSAWLIAYTMESIFLSDKAKCNSFLTTAEDRKTLNCP